MNSQSPENSSIEFTIHRKQLKWFHNTLKTAQMNSQYTENSSDEFTILRPHVQYETHIKHNFCHQTHQDLTSHSTCKAKQLYLTCKPNSSKTTNSHSARNGQNHWRLYFVITATRSWQVRWCWCWWLLPRLRGLWENVRPYVPRLRFFFFFFFSSF